MRAAAVAESEVSSRQLKRFAGEDVTGIRTGVARQEQRVDSELFVFANCAWINAESFDVAVGS